MRSPVLEDRSIAAYDSATSPGQTQQLRTLADGLADSRILHVNSTATGGGVAELLQSIVPLCSDLGVDTDWLVMDANEGFFEITKSLHNGLQGKETPLTDEMKATYRDVVERNAGAIDDQYDVVVLHDPQALGMVETLAETMPNAAVVWRCHIDLSDPSHEHLAFVSDYTERVDHAVFSRSAYESEVSVRDSSVVYPSIDPLAPKNRDLDDETITAECEQLPISFDAPLVAHVSRFDPWKDQFGTLEAYRRISERIPDLQLALVGGMAADDPEGREIYDRVAVEAADDPDVHLLADLPNTTMNVLQRRSDVVVQKSLREGFGLVVAEALWKRTPVVGSNVGGIPLQIVDGENGYLVEPDSIEALAERTEALLEDEEQRKSFGQNGREHVREGFLLPRQVADWLEVFVEFA
ncbi:MULTISPECIES: glycosyltransferase [Natrialbaceae]|uniref:glycosyltransferase n=1 Tax=Natrialbaceae TaxID=1644061 RepID=UPI00207D6513|nr:glycosyltransferase [Natronococcus sp. CG52]